MTAFDVGRKAEAAVTAFLERKCCTIIGQNWRTRWCEIDVIATRENVVYFCEVKYRSHNRQGDGLDYITPSKLRQMQFSANVWLAAHQWQGESQLCAIAVTGLDFHVCQVVKI
jgi:uncharacterized protein (TIGR00252 family)